MILDIFGLWHIVYLISVDKSLDKFSQYHLECKKKKKEKNGSKSVKHPEWDLRLTKHIQAPFSFMLWWLTKLTYSFCLIFANTNIFIPRESQSFQWNNITLKLCISGSLFLASGAFQGIWPTKTSATPGLTNAPTSCLDSFPAIPGKTLKTKTQHPEEGEKRKVRPTEVICGIVCTHTLLFVLAAPLANIYKCKI